MIVMIVTVATFFWEKVSTAFFIREKIETCELFSVRCSIHPRMYVFVTKIIILVVVILPLPIALGPACYYDWPQSRPKG
jgi:hypothetical protein